MRVEAADAGSLAHDTEIPLVGGRRRDFCRELLRCNP
jgi:hypothetical protein